MINSLKRTLAIPLYRLYESRLSRRLDRAQLPRHLGIILDGHRRYARAEGHETYTDSYRTGMRTFEEVVAWTGEFEIPSVTAWVLSTENLKRPAEEIGPYFDVLVELFDRLPDLARRHNFELKVIGSLDPLPPRLVAAAKRAMEDAGVGLRSVTIAMGYGGRQEIVDACRDLVDELTTEGVTGPELAGRINADGIASHLYAPLQPDTDLIIRTSGESRMSGFLLWQSAYAEYAFVDVYWPAFRRVDFIRALRDYAAAERRFGQ